MTTLTHAARLTEAGHRQAPRSGTASATTTVLFAGGGTGGHILPNVAIAERLLAAQGTSGGGSGGAEVEAHYLVSSRAIDERIARQQGIDFTALSAQPLSTRPWRWPGFLNAFFQSVAEVSELLRLMDVGAVVATGGFVSGPAIVAANRRGIPVAMVNLDAVPGKANRRLAQRATQVFSVYASDALPGATPIGLPLRRAAVGPETRSDARIALGLDPDRNTLMITGGSQGAESVNDAVIELWRRPRMRAAMSDWQVLHLAGPHKADAAREAYEKLGVDAHVIAFSDQMGLAWRAATIAISRSGAGSVAEAWANRTPTIFLPYPFHSDDHQRLNAEPMARLNAAILLRDRVDPKSNANQLVTPLLSLSQDVMQRAAMIRAMTEHLPADGADIVAQWVMAQVAA